MPGDVQPRILVVDDESYICSIIVEALSAEKYEVTALTDPQAALEFLEKNPVDLVLTDLIMGDHSGLEVMEAALAVHSDAVVILMTAHPTVQTAIAVLKKGAYDFLMKPFRLELLKATIKRGLRHQQVIRENLQLRGQVEFLKVAGAAHAEVDTDQFLSLVAQSCQKELSATAVGIITVDPDTQQTVGKLHEPDTDDVCHEVLDEKTLDRFTYTKSSRPVVHSEETSVNGSGMNRIFISQPIIGRRRLHGVINVLVVMRFGQVTPGQLDALSILANSASSFMANQALYQDLRRSYLQAIRGLANAIEARDACTAGHTDRVCRLAELVARHMEWDERRIEGLIMGCTLHDIGKIGVPDCILNKPDQLTDAEKRRMEAHPEVGLMIIDGIDLFRPAIPYILAHHEWYDGSGYPNGLAGEDIPIEGRLLAVVDTFDAIMSNRPYRQGANLEVAVSELVKFTGTQFDPEIVDALLGVIRAGKIDFRAMFDKDEELESIARFLVSEKAQA